MSCRRKTLSEERKRLNILRELKADGVDVDIPKKLVERVRPVDVYIAPPPVSVACQLPSGRLVYVLGVRLLSRQRCLIEDCDFSVLWDDDIVLEHIERRQTTWSCESLVFSGLEFLNDRLERGLLFPRAGDRVEGFLLASGLSAVPSKYAVHGGLPITVAFSDVSGETSSAEQTIFFERAQSQRSIADSRGKPPSMPSESSAGAISNLVGKPIRQAADKHHLGEQDHRVSTLYL